MTIKEISKTFFAKLTKFQKNTKTSYRDSDSVNVNVCNYAKNNDNGPIVLMKGITCRFGNLIANQNITFDLKKGEYSQCHYLPMIILRMNPSHLYYFRYQMTCYSGLEFFYLTLDTILLKLCKHLLLLLYIRKFRWI